MKVDILSDLHLDFYFKPHLTTSENVTSLFRPILTDNDIREIGDVLIIAGDIGHYNEQNIEVLKILQKEFYKHIICVLGNHDYYLVNSEAKYTFENNSFKRVEDMRKLINQEKNIYCLNGEVIEIEGVKFGGADSWYDDITKLERQKLTKIYKNCDVMITHVNPSFNEEHIDKKYHNSPINTFFTFDGSKFYKDGSMKYWVFGHTHDAIEYEIADVKFLCNPLGYPNESQYGDNIKKISFEISL